MILNFGKFSEEFKAEIDKENDQTYQYFVDNSGNAYEFSLELTEDGAVIRDGLDRFVPLTYSSLLDLLKGLMIMRPTIEALHAAEQIRQSDDVINII